MQDLPPFNISLMDTRAQPFRSLTRVSTPDIWDSTTKDFHNHGLYSPVIFGRPGTEARDYTFARVELNTKVFHPNTFANLVKLKGLYKEILEGRTYAVFDKKEKDFVASDPIDGETGFAFFVKHFDELKFKKTNSDQRDEIIKTVMNAKKKNLHFIEGIPILPAGLREIEYEDGDRPKEHEVTKMYRRIVGVTSNITDIHKNKETADLDSTRWNIQKGVNEIYLHFLGIFGGKRGFFQSKTGSRKIDRGTRNVISAMNPSAPHLDHPSLPAFDSSQVGLLQFVKGTLPKLKAVLVNKVLDGFINEDQTLSVIDPKTYKEKQIRPTSETKEEWLTLDGFEKLTNKFEIIEKRSQSINVDGHYLRLCYIDHKKGQFAIFKSIDEASEAGVDIKKVRPLTYYELFYIAACMIEKETAGFITRYPVTGLGSIYATKLVVLTTRVSANLKWIGKKPEGVEDISFHNFPLFHDLGKKEVYFDTLIPHPSTLPLLGADFDGDTSSLNIVFSEDGVKDLLDYLDDPMTYLKPSGGLLHPYSNELTDWLFENYD